MRPSDWERLQQHSQRLERTLLRTEAELERALSTLQLLYQVCELLGTHITLLSLPLHLQLSTRH